MQCLILAGGLGTRMRPLTESIPKALIPVHGVPFASYQLAWLASEGVTEVVYLIGHLGSMIRAFVGDGSEWGLRVSYIDEGEKLRGTAGAVRLALDHGVLAERFFLLYGDSFLPTSFRPIFECSVRIDLPALLTVFRNEGQWDTSNVHFEAGMVRRYDKHRPDANMRFIDYGLSVLRRDLVAECVASAVTADYADLLHRLSIEGRLGGYEARERFYEIGSPEGLADFERDLPNILRARPASASAIRA